MKKATPLPCGTTTVRTPFFIFCRHVKICYLKIDFFLCCSGIKDVMWMLKVTYKNSLPTCDMLLTEFTVFMFLHKNRVMNKEGIKMLVSCYVISALSAVSTDFYYNLSCQILYDRPLAGDSVRVFKVF